MPAFWYLLIGALLILIALLGRLLDRLPVSPAMIYLLAGLALGPAGLDALELHPLRQSALIEVLTEIAVVIALFTVGIKLRVPLGDTRWWVPLRLATISMGVTILGVTLVAWSLFDFSVAMALLLGGVLAPTDPVLASEVQLRSPEDRDRLRFGLTGEGGLNDGTAFPFVLLALGLLGAGGPHFDLWHWAMRDLVWSVTAGLGIGFLVGSLLAAAVRRLRARFSTVIFDEFLLLGVIALSYGAALALHALGFLAVFAAGLALRRADDVRATADECQPLTPSMLSVNEQLERIAEVAIVLLVGVVLSTGYWSVGGLVLAAVLFLLIRPLSVWIGLAGAGEPPLRWRLLSWFGIRGIGSVYYAAYAVHVGGALLPYADAERLVGMVFTVIAASIVVHGISAAPLMAVYQRRVGRRGGRAVGSRAQQRAAGLSGSRSDSGRGAGASEVSDKP